MEQLDIFEVLYNKLPTRKNIKLGTFFSGIGSPEMALTELSKEYNFNYETMFYSEIDKYAIKAYCAIHNQVEDDCLGSITDIKGVDLPYCDVWVGGFPCQDISLAGKGKGFSLESESRSSLGWEMIRLIREVEKKPKYIVFENVAAIFNEKHRPILNIFKRDLEDLGYTLYNDLLNAKNYGIPQNRNRYFLVAILGKYNYKFPKPIKLELRLKDMLEDEVDDKYYLSDKMINFVMSGGTKNFYAKPEIDLDIARPPTASMVKMHRAGQDNYISVVGNTNPSGNGMNGNVYDSDYLAPTITTNKGEGAKIIQLNNPIHSNNRVYDISGVSPTVKTNITGGNQQPFIKIPEDTKQGYAIARDGDGIYIDRPHQKRGVVQKGMTPTIKCSGDDLGVVVKSGDGIYLDQLSRNKANTERGISTTLKAQNCHNGVVEDLRIRKLTPKECYRLMGFSDEDYERAAKVVSNTQLYKTAGNSIVVKVLERIFTNLFMLEELNETRM